MAINTSEYIGPNSNLDRVIACCKSALKSEYIADLRLVCDRDRNNRSIGLWEAGGNIGEYGAAICAGDLQAYKMRPMVCRRALATIRANGDHALLPLSDRCIVMLAGHIQENNFLFVYQVVNFELGADGTPYVNLRLVCAYSGLGTLVSGNTVTLPTMVVEPQVGLPTTFFNSEPYKDMLRAVLVKSYIVQNRRPNYCLKWEIASNFKLESIRNEDIRNTLDAAGVGGHVEDSVMFTDWAALVNYCDETASYVRATHDPRNEAVNTFMCLVFSPEDVSDDLPPPIVEDVQVELGQAPAVPAPAQEPEHAPVKAVRVTAVMYNAYADRDELACQAIFIWKELDKPLVSPSNGRTVSSEGIVARLTTNPEDWMTVAMRYKGD